MIVDLRVRLARPLARAVAAWIFAAAIVGRCDAQDPEAVWAAVREQMRFSHIKLSQISYAYEVARAFGEDDFTTTNVSFVRAGRNAILVSSGRPDRPKRLSLYRDGAAFRVTRPDESPPVLNSAEPVEITNNRGRIADGYGLAVLPFFFHFGLGLSDRRFVIYETENLEVRAAREYEDAETGDEMVEFDFIWRPEWDASRRKTTPPRPTALVTVNRSLGGVITRTVMTRSYDEELDMAGSTKETIITYDGTYEGVAVPKEGLFVGFENGKSEPSFREVIRRTSYGTEPVPDEELTLTALGLPEELAEIPGLPGAKDAVEGRPAERSWWPWLLGAVALMLGVGGLVVVRRRT